MKTRRLPEDDKTNGWSGILPAREPHAALIDSRSVDWLVIGAGYAGLAAARRLAENRPGDEIVIIDAGTVGENASGRNSGFAIDLPHNVGSSLEELDGSHRFMRLARMSIDYLEQAVTNHSIQCDWSRDGKYHTAVSTKGTRDVLEPFVRELEALGEPFEWLDRQAVTEKLGSPHFNAAVYTPGCVLMNPAGLVRGLADSLPENVSLYENTPAMETNFGSRVFKTRNGSVKAKGVIVAANGFSEQFGYYPRRFLHLSAHASLTRPLTASEQQDYGVEKPWGLTPANAFAGITMRYTNDRRLLLRQGLGYCPSQRVTAATQAKVREHHRLLLAQRFPTLSNVDLEFTWSGIVCLSQNSAPGFGMIGDQVWSAVCQNAVGVTKGTFSGVLVADMATGRENPLIEDMISLGEPSVLPPRPLLDIGVRSRFAWELLKNRHER